MKQDKSDEQPKQPQKRGLFGYIFVSIVVSIASLAAVAYWLSASVVTQVNQKHQKQLVDVYTRQYESYFNSALAIQQQTLERMASSNDVISAIRSGDDILLKNLGRNLAAQIPGALNVRLLEFGRAELDNSSNPPLNFAGIDMIRRAENGQQVPVEALQANGQPYLQMVAAIRGGGTIIGSMSLSLDLSVMRSALSSFDPSAGSVTLEQQFDNGPIQTLVQYGAKNTNPSITIRTNNPNWRLSFQPADTVSRSELLSGTTIFVPLAIVGVIFIVAAALTASMLQKTLRNDASDFTRYTQKLLTGHNIEAPDFRLALFVSMAKSLARVKIAKPKPGTRGSPEVTSPFESPVGPLAEEPVAQEVVRKAPTDEILEIDMMEGDQDLLGMDSEHEAEPMMSLQLSETIFRAHDIRGIYGETLDAQIAKSIGLAVGSEAYERGEQTLIVGRDARHSSEELAKYLITGLTQSGRDVIDLGVVPIPMVYYATQVLGVVSGIMVTGSHNPATHNGFKLLLGGQSLNQDEIKGLYHRINSENFLSGQGSVSQNEIVGNYINRIAGDVRLKQSYKVVVDAGNAVTGRVAPQIFSALGCDVIPLNCELDGNFPNHLPEPSDPNNLKQLQEAVLKNGADLGIAFDGDGDRIGVVSSSGKVVYPDKLLMVFAKDLLTRQKGCTVIYDVKSSRRLQGLIVGFGGRPLMWKTGHALIKKKMIETGAMLAGGMSGRVFFKERWYGFDDALYTAARLLEVLDNTASSLDALLSSFPDDVSTPELSIEVDDAEKVRIMDRLARNAVFSGGSMSTIDGVRADFPDGWGLVRGSNSTSKLVFRFEADNEPALMRIQENFKQQLLSIDSSLRFPF